VFTNAKNAAVAGAAKQGAGRFAQLMGRAPGLRGGLAVASAPMMVAWVGDMMGVNKVFEQGSGKDMFAEGALVGASFGAMGGGPAAAIGAAAGGILNTMTDGGLVDVAQNVPWIGGMFGSPDDKDVLGIAKTLFEKSAAAQGSPEMAEAAATMFESYYKMIEAEVIPPGSEFEFMMMAGRQAGLKGVPWAPEELTPVYSADDLAQITGVVSEELQPMYDVATGLMQQEFEYIQDEELRGRLIESAQQSAANLMESIGVATMGPATAGILTESQRRQSSTDLSGQLGAQDEFAAMFADASGF
jgi:hypothetical protein